MKADRNDTSSQTELNVTGEEQNRKAHRSGTGMHTGAKQVGKQNTTNDANLQSLTRN